jgi:phospholipid/cholesterol/gamma-HCH transport system ATP-binding protein
MAGVNDDTNGGRDASAAPAIEFRHVSLSLDGETVLRDISFTLRRGQMICVTGASGSGKSVLLRLAAGFFKPDAGRIFVGGREIELLGEDELLAIRGGLMGMVFQEESLFTGVSVYENAAYRPLEHGWPEEETEASVREALSFVGLEGDVEKMPEELSGGMKRRLEIARAVVGWPPIMLFDEPTSGLDPLNEGQVLDLILRARDLRGISSLFVTKQLHEISYLANHRAAETEAGVEVRAAAVTHSPDVSVLLLHEGAAAFFGAPDDFFRDTSPAVTYLTRAGAEKSHTGAYVVDPWDRRRRWAALRTKPEGAARPRRA